jgi:hypothetical protein
MAFALSSPAFENGGPIPDRYARRGNNVSPPLQWTEPPPGTQSFVLLMEDPDAPVPSFRHWIVYDIPAERRHLPEGGSSGARVEGLRHGVNDFRNPHYDGPQPPVGDPPHTYRLRLAALGVGTLGLEGQPSAAEVWDHARANILSEAELTGTYRTQA